MTCVAIETLGQVMYGARNREGENRQKDCFVAVARALDKNFSRQLNTTIKTQLETRWKDKEVSKCSNAADLLYHFFRNSMIHAYRGHAVYLTETDTQTWMFGDGCMLLNPYWFWEAYKIRYQELFDEIALVNSRNPRRFSCIAYIDGLLK
jgi:hypothetical protein